MPDEFDNDIKIVGGKPSETVRKNMHKKQEDNVLSPQHIVMADALGRAVAKEYCNAGKQFLDATGDSEDTALLRQRQLLLSFTVTVGFEKYLGGSAMAGYAQKSFLDELNRISGTLFQNSSDTGAFSFYYLAYRRGAEVERRIGQTFAMLCSHDGDPIYQELGEALFCWFLSVIEEKCKQLTIAP